MKEQGSPETTEQIEQLAQDIWERRLLHDDIREIAHKYGFTANESMFMPGFLIPADLERIIPPGADTLVWSGINLLASPGAK